MSEDTQLPDYYFVRGRMVRRHDLTLDERREISERLAAEIAAAEALKALFNSSIEHDGGKPGDGKPQEG